MSIWIRRSIKIFVTLILLVVGVGLVLPTEYNVVRSVSINAMPEDIHVYVGDLTKWDLWSPWKEEDPTIVTTLGEKTSGVGAYQSWVAKDGDGSLTFTKVSPIQGIEYDLFFDGGEYHSIAGMHYNRGAEAATTVMWRMTGNMDMPVFGGYFAMLMDSMAGPMFERGLEKLKAIVEKA